MTRQEKKRAYQKQYEQTPAGKAARRKYDSSHKGRQSKKRYRDSEAGQIMRHLWFTTPEFRLWNRLRMQEQRSGPKPA